MIFQNCLKITYDNFEVSHLVVMPNITPNHAFTYTNYALIFNPVIANEQPRKDEAAYAIELSSNYVS